MAADTDGNVYVADSGNHRIQKFSNVGTYIGELESTATGAAAFGHAVSCAVDGNGTLYVQDDRGYIDVFDPQFQFVRNWPAAVFHLALDRSRQFLYATAVPDSIIKYDAATGGRVAGWQYLSNGSFWGFGVGPSGDVYISQSTAVVKFAPDGTFLTAWGALGAGDGQFLGARGIAVDAMEHVYVGDGNRRVQAFTSDGTFLSAFGSSFSTDLVALATNSAGSIFVLDNGSDQIQKYSDSSTPTRRLTWGALKCRYR